MTNKRLLVLACVVVACGVAGAQLASVQPANSRLTEQSAAAHTYFETLRGRSEHVASYSLRDQSELTRYSQKPQDINYLWPNDPDPRKQDAAKLVLPSDGSTVKSQGNRNSIRQVRLPMPAMELGHAYLVTWDAWYGREWDDRESGIEAYKAFQFDAPKGPGFPPTAIYWEISHRYRHATSKGRQILPSADLARLAVRHYAAPMRQLADGRWIGVPVGPNVTSGSKSVTPITPYREFNIRAERWIRHWQLIEYGMDREPWRKDPPGTLMSLWAADENREPVQIYNRLQVTLWPPGISRFWIEMNTSQNEIKPGRGNLTAYFRNVVMLKDVADVSALLQRPVK